MKSYFTKKKAANLFVLMLIISFFWGTANGQITNTITFESASIGSLNNVAYQESGFTIEDGALEEFLQIIGTEDGYPSKSIFNLNYDRIIRLRKTDNSVFDLASFDYAGGRWGEIADASVTGYLQAGGTITANTSSGLKNYTNLLLNWKNLTKVEINFRTGTNTAYGALDNFAIGSHELPADLTPPSIPTGLASSAITATSFDVSWNVSTDNIGVTGYEIFVDGVLKGTSATTSFSISGLAISTVYAITVKAKDATGNLSAASSTLNVTTIPIPVFNITYTEGTDTAPTVSNIDLLQIAATVSSSSGTFDNEGSGGLSVLTNGNATNGIANRAGISSGSSITYTFNTTVNTAGYNINEISIFSSWNDNGRLTPNVTVLYALASDPGTFISLGTTEFTPTVVFPNPWTKSIFAIGGGSTLSGVVAIKFDFGAQQNGFVGYTELDVIGIPTGSGGGADVSPPSIPANLVANNIASNAVTLSWDASTDNFGVTSYDVYEGATLVGSPNTNTYTVSNLSSLTAYTFTVVAKDGAGNVSAASTALSVTTISGPVFSIVYTEGNTNAPSVLNDDLLQTSATLTASSGNFTNEGSTGLATLINGTALSGIANRAAISNNSSITYTLNTTINASGYNIRGINIYSGWGDPGRLIPNVKVLYSLVADPATFLTLGTATFNPSSGAPNPWTKSSFTANGAVIASGVAALKFDFGNQQNGYVGYSEIDVVGNPDGPDNIVPSTPTAFTSDSITASSVVLNWTASTDNFGIAGYEIYEGSNLLALTSNNTYKVTGLSASTTYSFTVRAKDVSDLFSVASEPLSVTTSAPDITPPSIPSGLVISAIAPSSFRLSWQASTDNFVVTRYIVYLGTDSVATVSGLTYTYTGLTPATLYTASVVAVDDSYNKSAASSQATATTLAFQLEGFTEDFNDGDLNGWSGGTYGLSNDGNKLKVVANKGGSAWSAFSYTFNMADISVYPYITFKAKSKFDVNLTIAVGNLPGVVDAYPLRLKTIDGFNSQEILAGNSEWQEYTFDFSGVTHADLSKVDYMQILVNPLGIISALPDSNIFYIEDLRIGKDAKPMAAVTSIRDISFKAGTVEPKTIRFYGLTDGSDGTNPLTITATSSNTAVVPNPVVNYTSPAKLGSLTVAPNNGVSGEAVITLKISAAGVTDKLSTFKVNVMANQAPVMKPITNLLANIGQAVEIPLLAINDGDGDTEQTISITAFSSNTTFLPAGNISINHAATASTGLLTLTSASSIPVGSVVQLTVKLKDNGGIDLNGVDSSKYTFNVTFYDKVNKVPVITPTGIVRINAQPQPRSILLNGIGDGDDGTQTLNATVVATNRVGTNYTVGPIANGKAFLNFNLTGNIGTDTVVVRLTDNGGAGNNGPLFVEDTIIIIGNIAPQTWYVNNFDNAADINGWSGDGAAHTFAVANSQLHIKTDIRSLSYPGIFVDLMQHTGGKYIDISAKKYLSFNLKGATTNTNKPGTISIALLDDNALADGYHTRTMFIKNVPADGQFHKYVFDYTNLFYTQNNLTLDSTHIKGLLINIDNDWFNAYTGDYYFDDFKLGDSAEVNFVPRNTIADISDRTYSKGQVPAAIRLTGISDGKGNLTTNLLVSANNSVVENLAVTTAVNGEADLTFTLNTPITDSTKIRIIADDLSSAIDLPDTTYLNVYVVDTASAATVEVRINLNQQYQTMIGMGSVGASNSPAGFATTTDQNFTLMRIFGDFDEMENQNDNGDPNSINMANLSIDQGKMDYYRKIKETTTCKEFFYTVLSPAAWLKLNKSRHPDASTTWADNNRINPALYEEFAEFLVIIIKAIKEKAGIDLKGISIQNEPEFNQPYPSCQISGAEFVEIMRAVGDRFAAEGITTRLIMSEDVSLGWTQSRVNPVIADPSTRKYLDIIAVHNYGENGVTAGGGSQSSWADTYDWFATTPAKDLWMTETSGFTNKWEGEIVENYLIPGEFSYAPGPFGFGGYMFSALKSGRISAWVDLDPKENSGPLRAAFKQYSKFIEPGSIVVNAQSFNNSVLSIAFKNPLDNSLSIVLTNTSYQPQKVQITGQGVPLTYSSVYTANNAYFKTGLGTQNGFYLMAPRSIVTLKSTLATLPVSLVDLKATRKDKVIELTWKTQQESNNQGFDIERSADGINFSQPIGFANSKAINGNSTNLLHYSFNDAAPLNGINYYRLKQIDKDGKFAYSNTVVVNFTVAGTYKVANISPNPAPQGASISVLIESGKTDKAILQVMDATGRVLAEKMIVVQAGSNSYIVNTKTLSAGVYYFKLKSSNLYENGTQPFIIR